MCMIIGASGLRERGLIRAVEIQNYKLSCVELRPAANGVVVLLRYKLRWRTH